MHFAQLSIVAVLATFAHGQISADRLVASINSITELSSDTNDVAQSITLTNFISTAPQLIDNFRQIITLVADDITAAGANPAKAKRQEGYNVEDVENYAEDHVEVTDDSSKTRRHIGSTTAQLATVQALSKRQNSPPYDTANQQAICQAFREFVLVHQQLLATVIGKHGLLSLTPFTQPLAAVLRVLEEVVDTLAFAIIDAVPTCAGDATGNKNQIDQSLQRAVDEYN